MNTRLLIISFISFCLGIIYFEFIENTLFIIIACFILILAGLAFLFLRKRNASLLIFVIILSFSVGSIRYINDWRHDIPELNDKYLQSQIEIEALVYLDPEKKFDNTRIYFKSKIDGVENNFTALIDQYQNIEYGDFIRMQGRISRVTDFVSDNGKSVKYSKLMQKNGIYYQIRPTMLQVVSKNNLSSAKLKLYRFKYKLEEKFNMYIREPESSFASGIIFGDKRGFSDEFNESFIRSGTIHIVALSGYNVTILGQFVMNFLELFLSFSVACVFGVLIIILFVIMTGGQATAVRSAIMGIIALFAKRFGLQNSGLRALLFAGIIMLFINPWILIYDMSFQLSFLATAGLIILAPILEARMQKITTRFEIRYIIATTISATVVTFPYLLYKMGYTSVVSLPANLFILPFMFPLMILALSGLALTFVGSGFVLKILFYLLKYQIWVSDFFAKLKFAVFDYEIKIWQMVILYLVIGAVFYLLDVYNERLKEEAEK